MTVGTKQTRVWRNGYQNPQVRKAHTEYESCPELFSFGSSLLDMRVTRLSWRLLVRRGNLGGVVTFCVPARVGVLKQVVMAILIRARRG